MSHTSARGTVPNGSVTHTHTHTTPHQQRTTLKCVHAARSLRAHASSMGLTSLGPTATARNLRKVDCRPASTDIVRSAHAALVAAKSLWKGGTTRTSYTTSAPPVHHVHHPTDARHPCTTGTARKHLCDAIPLTRQACSPLTDTTTVPLPIRLTFTLYLLREWASNHCAKLELASRFPTQRRAIPPQQPGTRTSNRDITQQTYQTRKQL